MPECISMARGLPIEEADRIADEVKRRIHGATDAGYRVIQVDVAEWPATPEDAPTAMLAH